MRRENNKMSVDWANVLARLNAYPAGTHKFLPPCPEEKIEAVQMDLGKMPEELASMLRHFSGAHLFDRTGPLISLFGITPASPLPPFEWAPDWCIDKYTPEWRR